MRCDKSMKFFALILFWVFILNSVLADLGNPYKILGVDRKATLQQIRKAYKQLAKEWHPDKSDNPSAEEKFVEIKKAYELLADTERREAYDLHGITNEDANIFKGAHDYSHYGRFATDPFQEFFGQRNSDISLLHKLSITSKYYETHVIPNSSTTPYMLMFYADWCFTCSKAAGIFKKMIDNLEPLGVVFATVNTGHEESLLRKTGVHSLPCIVLVLDGKNYVYKDSVFSVQKVVDFMRIKLPYKLIQPIDDNNVDEFLSGWSDNRVRGLVMEPRTQPRLRYLISAFHYRHRVAFGFVQLNSKDTAMIQERYKVHPSLDTVLLFNEDMVRPVASVSMSDIPTQLLNNVIATNQYLALPRLSSQDLLEGICPAEWNRPRKRLCVILVTENTEMHDEARDALRKIALESGFSSERVRFAYIYQEKQTDFVNALTKDGEDTLLRLVIIWRRDTSHIKYEWVSGASLHIKRQDNETAEYNFNITKQKLDNTIQRLLRASEALSYEAEVKDLINEHAQGMFSQILNKVLLVFEYLSENIGEEHLLPVLSVIGTFVFIVGVGYFMAYLVRIEEENVQKKQSSGNNNNNGVKPGAYVPELKLHELRAEKYNGLVRLLKPGCRTIVLVTDLQSRANLIPGYHKAVWPYRKNKTLMFAHMLIEKGHSWYADLLRLSLSESRDLQINPRNCIGTVLALNGHRKYFCMYHAKHPESLKGAKRMIKMTRHLTRSSSDPEAGAFLGLNSDTEDTDIDDSDTKILLEENLLDGLSNWLDRLFEGVKPGAYVPELKLHELRAEKYNGLVRLLKPGCRTIVLVTDLQSRANLIPGYHKAVWPYRKNKTLMFAHMLIEKGHSWYADLLRLSLSESRDLQINPRNCIGTVLALNGHRKYFCMYHAKHPESLKGAKRMIKMTRHLTRSSSDPEAGAFLGLNSDTEDTDIDDSDTKILLEENLLDGLSNWLDRLFEGTTHRYYINYWPDFTTK